MGAAWCKDRPHSDSKAPLDRILLALPHKVFSSDRPTITSNPTGGKGNADPSPTPVHFPRVERPVTSSEWEPVTLHVPDAGTPVPPPRRKRMQRRVQEAHRRSGVGAPRPVPPPCPERSVSTTLPPSYAEFKPRPKFASTVSLPNFDELDVAVEKQDAKVNKLKKNGSTTSLNSISDITIERLESYMKRCRSFGSMDSGKLIEKIHESMENMAHEDVDPWENVDDYDLGVVEHIVHPKQSPPVKPKFRLASKTDRRVVSTHENRPKKFERMIPASPLSETIAESPPDDFHMSEIMYKNRMTKRGSTTFEEIEIKNQPAEVWRTFSEEYGDWFGDSGDCLGNVENTSGFSAENRTQGLSPDDIAKEAANRRKKISVASKTPPPSPDDSQLGEFEDALPDEDENTHSTLLKLITKYKESKDKSRKLTDVTNSDPNHLNVNGNREGDSSSSSRRSSMTPSLNELEEALSDLLEKNRLKDTDDDKVGDNKEANNNLVEKKQPVTSNGIDSKKDCESVTPIPNGSCHNGIPKIQTTEPMTATIS